MVRLKESAVTKGPERMEAESAKRGKGAAKPERAARPERELTKAELELMQVIWSREKVLVHDILDELPEPKPAYNTVSTIVRILEQKGFVGHKAYGRTYEYFALVSKEEYTQRYMTTVLDNFFDGSLSRLVSFFSEQESIPAGEVNEILDMLKKK